MAFSSLYIYYISGTGNAKVSSEWIADEAGKRGIKAVVRKIDRLPAMDFPEPDEEALIGFAFPTHGFNAAPIMLRFIAGFPRNLSKNVFVLNTRAGMKLSKLFMPGISGIALIVPAMMLRIKGYRCIAYRSVDLPSNWIPLHPGLKKKVIDSIFKRCERIVRSFANRLLDGKKEYSGLYSLPIDLLLSPVSLGYYIGGRFFLSKTFIASDKCTVCGVCIRECPTSSIVMADKQPYWKLSCESCMRCMNICPEKAIETSHGMAVIFWVVFTAVNAEIMLLIATTGINLESIWWRLGSNIMGIAGMVFVTAMLYRMVHFCMRSAFIRKMLRHISFTALPFWRRYKPGKK